MVSIFLADDHAIVREGLRSLLRDLPAYQIIGEAADGRTTLTQVCARSPDILILDMVMPDMHGLEVAKILASRTPNVRIIGLSMHTDLDFVIELLRIGARGYLVKESAFDELHRALQLVMDGQLYVSQRLGHMMIADYVHRFNKRDTKTEVHLTARENDVLTQIADGRANKEIAQQLGITVRSAETYRAQIMDKLNLHTVAELTKYAIRTGLTSL